MDKNGKYDHIEDVLINLHNGQWFGWSDPKNKIYENLIIHDESKDKPTKKFLEDELKKQQNEFDSLSWMRSRVNEYPDFIDCIHALLDGGDTLTNLQAKRAEVKAKYPKPT
jgi:hypothetical protein